MCSRLMPSRRIIWRWASARSPLAMLSTHARHSSGLATGNTVTAKDSMSAPPSEARLGVRFSHADRAVSIRSSAAAFVWGLSVRDHVIPVFTRVNGRLMARQLFLNWPGAHPGRHELGGQPTVRL